MGEARWVSPGKGTPLAVTPLQWRLYVPDPKSDDAHARMPYFLLTFGDASRPPVAAIIMEAPSMFQARTTAVVRRLAFGVPFGEGLNLSAEMMTSIPPEQIGRMMSGLEAAELILRLVQSRRRPGR
jgi:hypothetical protein